MDIKYENNIKEEDEYFNFRKEYQILYQNIFSIKSMGELVIQSLCHKFDYIKLNMDKCSYYDLELPLFLMNCLHQARKDQNETNLLKIPFFQALEINFPQVDSEIVLLQYHDLLSRYIQYYMADHNILKFVIDIYLGDKGIMYPNIKLGSKFCHLFVKFLDKNKNNLEFIAFDTAIKIKNVLDSLVECKNFSVSINNMVVIIIIFLV